MEAEREIEGKKGIVLIGLVFSLSFFHSRKYFLLLYIHTYINQTDSTSVLACRSFLLLVLAKFGACITTILILLFAFAYIYSTRIECAYTHIRTKRNHQWYIYKSDVRFFTHPRLVFLIIISLVY